MTPRELDFVFPFVVFGYGLIMTVITTNPRLLTLAEERLSPELYQQFRSRRALSTFCLIVGGLWSLQNLWLS